MAPGTMLKAFSDEAVMKKAYGQTLDYAIANKAQIKQFWLKGGEQKAAFLQNGCVVGLAWDSIMFGLIKEGQKFKYMSPVEGALTVMDTHAWPRVRRTSSRPTRLSTGRCSRISAA